MDILTFILSLLGAGAWIPFVISYLKKANLEFKLVHCNFMNNFSIDVYSPDNKKVEANKNMQCLTLGFTITTYNKRHVITGLSVTVRMKTGEEIIGIPHTKTMFFKNSDNKRYRLAIPGNMNILVNNDMPPDSSGLFYCNFLFKHPEAFVYKEIEAVFVSINIRSPNEMTKRITLNNDAIMNAAHINYVADIYTLVQENT